MVAIPFFRFSGNSPTANFRLRRRRSCNLCWLATFTFRTTSHNPSNTCTKRNERGRNQSILVLTTTMGCTHSTNANANQMGTVTASQSPKRVIVVGASGFVGKATLNSLVDRHSSTLKIYAGVRDPSKFEDMAGVTPVKADLNNKSELTALLKDFDRAFIVTPGHADRTKLAINGLEAAEDAGIEFVAVVSVLTSGTDSIFGKQFAPIEAKAKALNIPTSILRLPLFIDNNWSMLTASKGRAHSTTLAIQPRSTVPLLSPTSAKRPPMSLHRPRSMSTPPTSSCRLRSV